MTYATWVVAGAAAACAAAVALLTGGALRGGASALRSAWWRVAEHELAQQFIFVDPRRMAAASLPIVGGLGLAGFAAGLPALPLCLGLAIVALAPQAVVPVLRRRRNHRLQAQLPDTLALWAGLLRAGRGMAPALAELATHQPPPIGQELQLLVRQVRLGLPLDAALAAFAARVPDADLVLVATTLKVSHDVGGNVAESLQRLSTTIRDRLLMEERIRALTAQGRLQGAILGLLPAVLLVVLCLMEPALPPLLLEQPAGWAALAVIAALEAAGFLLIRRIVSIRV